MLGFFKKKEQVKEYDPEQDCWYCHGRLNQDHHIKVHIHDGVNILEKYLLHLDCKPAAYQKIADLWPDDGYRLSEIHVFDNNYLGKLAKEEEKRQKELAKQQT